jgi:hypothetical protein
LNKIIEIVVSPKGDTTVTTKGFAGSECQQASRSLESALGNRTSEQITAEFHQGHQTRQSNEQRT